MLDGYAIDWWDSDMGVSLVSGAVDTWTGQKRGIVLSAPSAGQRPAYGADGSYFKGRNVVQSANSGNKLVRSLDVGFDIYAAGSDCYVLTVGRLRSIAPDTGAYGPHLVSISNTGGAQQLLWQGTYDVVQPSPGMDFGIIRDSANVNRHTEGQAHTSGVILKESWVKSGGNLRRNLGTTYNTAGSDGLASDIGVPRSIGLGGRADGYSGATGDYSIRFAVFCTTKPPDALVAGVLQYFRNDSGF